MKKFIYYLGLFILFLIAFPTNIIGQCTTNDATACVCLNSSETDCDLLPDIMLSWYALEYYSGGPTEYPQTGAGSNNGRLRISVSTPNDGFGPLTVRGVDENGWAYFICDDDTIIDYNPSSNLSGYSCPNGSNEPARQITFQRVYHRNSDGTMSYYDRMAGSMTYHPTHGHNHSDAWGVFTLRTIDENDPNPLNWPTVSDGAKMGFCLMDYGTCGTGTNSTYYGHCRDENRYSEDFLVIFPGFNDGTNGGTVKYNNDFPNFGLGGGNYGCSPIEQGISSGYLDLYGEWLDDQWINIDSGLCNGVYWIVGEVDKNNNYLESNEDNNWTAIAVTLTQQSDSGGYYISIFSPDTVNLCNGETTTLFSPDTTTTNDYLWSNGETTPSIEVGASGEYSLTIFSICGEGESQVVTVLVNDTVENPITNNITIESGDSAVLNATADGNIIWQTEDGTVLGEGNEFISDPLYEDTTFYVVNENILIEAPETLSVGADEHEGSSNYSGTVYNGGLLFDCFEAFTLNSVKVYTDNGGGRTIELHNDSGNVINDSLINIPVTGGNGYIIDLNWDIPVGSNYILTTNTQMNNANFGHNNPMLKRTAGNLPEFPYILDNILEISEGMYDDGNGPGFSTSYYYYFYDWKITNNWGIGGSSCFSDVVEVHVFVNEPTPTGLNVTDIVHNRVTINWDNMNDANWTVDQYRIKYKEVGTNSWSQKSMGTPLGSCTWACNKTDKLILDLTAGTTYEYKMRAWYCGGGNSSWSDLHTFTTLDACPNIGNLSVTTPTTTKATFSWDDSNGPYSFVRLKSRVDTIASPVGSDWFNIGGAGVSYPTFTKDKNNLTPGQSYRAQARTWCNPNGGPYKSDTWTSLVSWTQPTSVRIEGGESISHLDVYPNPSRDIFNITFTSETIQDLRVRVLNVIGEELISDDLQQFIGEYTKQIDLTNNAKGIYFLEIETDNGVINKKLILQ